MPPCNEPTAGADAEKDKQIAFLKAALQERDTEIGKCLLDILLSFSKRLYLPDALKTKHSEAKQLKIPKPHGQAALVGTIIITIYWQLPAIHCVG